MKVLHLISSGGLYGAEAVILQLSAVLNRPDASASQIGIFAHAGQPPPALYEAAVSAGVRAHLLPCRGQLDLSVGGVLRDLCGRIGAEVVHCHGYKADIYAFFAFRGGDRPALVSTCHTWYDNDWAVRLYGAADRWVLRSFDEVVAVSSAVETRLRRAGVVANRIQLIRNGIAPVSDPEPKQDEPRPNDTVQSDTLRVGLVGRLAPEKGVDLFLDAAARLAPRFPEARFLVAGEGPDRIALEERLDRLQLRGRAELLGQQADMPAFYRSLDLLVSASREEGLPMALLEGMGLGLPVVASAVGEVPNVVVDRQTGLLVPAGSADELAAAVARLLSDGSLRERFGEAGRQRVAGEFSADRMAAAYLEVYRLALQRRKLPRAATVRVREGL